jgi:hypothetical protein
MDNLFLTIGNSDPAAAEHGNINSHFGSLSMVLTHSWGPPISEAFYSEQVQ